MKRVKSEEIKALESIIKALEKKLESVPKRSIEANWIRIKIKTRNHMITALSKIKKK